MKKIYVVPHTHWDSEWYFTKNDSRTLIIDQFTFLVETLEKNEDYPVYELDAQMSLVKEFVDLVPEYKERFFKLINKGRIIVGPWFAQSDSRIPKGETLFRNVERAKELATRYKIKMSTIGYSPDPFGYNINLPQILVKSNINTFIFRRGGDFNKIGSTHFTWKAPSGHSVKSVGLRYGYGYALNENLLEMKGNVVAKSKKLLELSKGAPIVIPNGHDQCIIDDKLLTHFENVKKDNPEFKWFLTSFRTYMNKLDDKEYPTFVGELTEALTSRIHKTIIGNRPDIKSTFYDLENKVINTLEPMMVMADSFGIKRLKIAKFIEEIWDAILYSSAHDSLGTCNSDATNDDILARLKGALQTTDSLINLIVRYIAEEKFKNFNKDVVTLINPLPKTSKQFFDVTLVSKYKHIKFVDENNKTIKSFIYETSVRNGGLKVDMDIHGETQTKIPDYQIHKAIIFIEVDALSLKNIKIIATNKNDFNEKKCSEIKINDKLIELEIMANGGDNFDFSPLKGAKTIRVPLKDLKGQTFTNGHVKVHKFTKEFKAPKDLESWSKNKVDLKNNIDFTIFEFNEQMHFKYQMINLHKNIQIRFCIPKNKDSENIIAQTQFGFIERKNKYVTDWQKKGYYENPVNYEPFIGSFILDDKYSVFSNNHREHENKKHEVKISFLRTQDVLGRNDLLWRPGRASGINNMTIHTPNSQLINKTIEGDFAIIPITNKIDIANFQKEYSTYKPYKQNQKQDTTLNRIDRFTKSHSNITKKSNINFSINTDKFVITSLRKDNKGKIKLRGFNVIDKKINFEVKAFGKSQKVIANQFEIVEVVI